MDSRRRRANDFTDSLTGFRQMDNEKEQTQTSVFQTYSEDSLDIDSIRNIQYRHNKHGYSKDESRASSIILAGNLATQQCISLPDLCKTDEGNHNIAYNYRQSLSVDTLNISDETSYLSIKPDLNKCINLFHNEHLNKEYDILGEYPSFNEKIETVTSLFVTSSNPLPNEDFHSAKEYQNNDTTNREKNSTEEFSSFEFENLRTFLHSLEDQKSLKEAAIQECLLKRMSANFCNSPKTFTERLLTIIEESVINNSTCASLEYPEVSLCRLTEELRKRCKFIEDETVPEWPQSPGMSMSIRARKSVSRKSDHDVLTSPDRGLCTITFNIKSPKKVRRHVSKIPCSIKSPMLDNTSTFEALEAYCKGLYPDDEHRMDSVEEKSRSQSPLQNMDSILDTCENQMASLDSPNIREQFRKIATSISDSAGQRNKIPGTPKKRTRYGMRNIEMIETKNLEDTLMYEIAKKRQRCLDTVKMMKIDQNTGQVGAQQICPSIVISETSPTSNDTKFMETLMSAKNYQAYLEEHKPLLNLLQRVELYGSSPSLDKKDVQESDKNFGTYITALALSPNRTDIARIPKFPTTRKKSTSPSSTKQKTANKVVVSKPKLFVTPGKASANKNCKPKRTYFPNLLAGTNKENGTNVSPHMKKIYRQIGNYDHVVSPVGMYIKGTNPYLVKHVEPISDIVQLTPNTLLRKKQTKRSLSPKPKMKLQLSPKQWKKEQVKIVIEDKDKTKVAGNFSHTKLHYTSSLSSHECALKEIGNRKVQDIKEIIRSTQDTLKSRQDRTKSVQTD